MRMVKTIMFGLLHAVAPHYFQATDLERLATGERKMPIAITTTSTLAVSK